MTQINTVSKIINHDDANKLEQASSGKITEYLQLILDRLDTHLDIWSLNMENNAEMSARLLELSLYSQKLLEIIEMENIPLKIQLLYIWNGLNLILDPLCDINERMITLFNDLDSLYTELKSLSETERKNSGIQVEINKLNQLKQSQVKNSNLRNFESFQSVKALIASLKESCYVTMSENSCSLSQITRLKNGFKHSLSCILLQCQHNHGKSRKWIVDGITMLEIMKFKTEDAQMEHLS